MEELCERYVERMGQEVEQLQMAALAHVMGVGVGVVDVAGSNISYLQHPAGDARPLFWLVHLPGHYEIVYPRPDLDVGALLRC
jgi:hypothetical protein